MRTFIPTISYITWRMTLPLVVLVVFVASSSESNAQVVERGRSVGGISIDADGVLESARVDDLGRLSRIRTASLEEIPAELLGAVPLRKVSLRKLEAAIEECTKTGKDLPDGIKYLAGLQQIQYVFVYPEQRDIVLVGPAEGWKVDDHGNIVGTTTGRPVMLLDDLLVALRTAGQAAYGGIGCSIDPTKEGLTRLRTRVSKLRTMGNPKRTVAGIENALGMQQVSITGVPTTSHFARVLVAADYRMKRIAMNFEPSPVPGLPSFLSMMTSGGRGMNNMLPRWWLEPNYQPILKSQDGLAWELRDAGVKTLTEEDFLTAIGDRRHTGKADPLAQKWADNMTEKFSQLAVADPIFGQMRNCMELAVVGALIVKERLTEKAGYSMPLLLDPAEVKTEEFHAPKQIRTQASVMKKGHNWVISASGGVLVNSWAIAEVVQQSDAPAAVRAKASGGGNGKWWWN